MSFGLILLICQVSKYMAQIKNTEKMKIHLNSFQGGESSDFKYGTTSSFYNSQALDFRSKISQMSVLPGFSNTSNNLNDLITVMTQDTSGIRYCVGNKGYLYKINTSGTITNFGQLTSNGAAGMVYNVMTDQLYISGQQDIS